MTGLMYAYYTSIGFYPTFLQNYVEIKKSQVSMLMIVGTTTSLFGQIFTGYLSQKKLEEEELLLCLLLEQLF